MKRNRGIQLAGAVWLLVMAFVAVNAANAQGPHGREYWRGIAAKRYEVPEGERAFPLAKGLSEYLKSSDPELRDDLAYSILAEWILEKNAFSGDELLALESQWQGNLKAGMGEGGTDSALCLAAIAEKELKSPFLGEERYRKLLDAALEYLKEEKDLRGFDEKKGWIHATAHTADLITALARHPLFTEADQARVLEAVGRRVETARVIFSFGEQDRLANTLAAMAGRADFNLAGFELWVNRMDKADF